MTADGPLINKFTVVRNDGSENHLDCRYFVLDLDHDPYAIPAMLAYIEACKQTHPELSKDLKDTAC